MSGQLLSHSTLVIRKVSRAAESRRILDNKSMTSHPSSSFSFGVLFCLEPCTDRDLTNIAVRFTDPISEESSLSGKASQHSNPEAEGMEKSGEPVSGQLGNGTATEPFDSGNLEGELSRLLKLVLTPY